MAARTAALRGPIQGCLWFSGRGGNKVKEIVINLEVYPEQDPSDDLTKKMHNYGWSVKVTKLPKKKWISLDDRVEFDNEEDCQAYDNEQFLIDERKRQREEEEQWLEEYHRRRRDPYWKNDSDYD